MRMLQYLLYFLTLLNPFALFFYLLPLKEERGLSDFIKITFRATFITFAIYCVFAIFGEWIFTTLLNVDFNSFRIFGGMVLLGSALNSIVWGKRAAVATKGEMNAVATQIALPFMVGTGTITMSILIGRELGNLAAVFSIGSVLAASFAIVVSLALARSSLKTPYKDGLDRTLEIIVRLNGFFVGSIGVDIIIRGFEKLLSS